MRWNVLTLGTVVMALGSACAAKSADHVAPGAADNSQPAADGDGVEPDAADGIEARLRTVLGAEHRDADRKARDEWRHPAETLMFFGIRDDMTVVELWPGSGWYTDILAPLLRERGKLIVTSYDPNGKPDAYATKSAKRFLGHLEAKPEVFDKVQIEIVHAPDDLPMGAEGSADMVLTFRNSHGWVGGGYQDKVYGAAFKVLKPGGVLGVVQHRAKAGVEVEDMKALAKKGYLPEAYLIDQIKAVGFELAEKSEINANPKDTTDHPEGVWTLPPGFALEDKDREKYAAIGESDRMTLKFVKP